ncbi:uncharacterized protein LOC111060315 isoform X5 [Nilaparvata lugens]|uniref:Seminal fluid protein n=1 Tax=Nilaparvata lugens TaxID=108931 RepID=A0A1I9WLB1_NILLU|nr:uncharacterized protein LOC111060315 isoform X5 [Nilaparvata lugens]APA33931.1 seminal fluid protein [Nilaparvata lugens]
MFAMRRSLVILSVLMIIEDCSSLASYQSSVNVTKRQAGECSFNKDCDENAWCTVDKKCERACTSSRMNCESWSRDGYCDGERHIPVCRFHSAIETDPISDVSELRYGSKSQDTYCEHTYECSPDLYCHTNNKCINPCKELLKCTTDGPDNPGFVVLRDNEEYPESNKISCIIKDYVLSCE